MCMCMSLLVHTAQMFTTQVRELLSALLWDPIEERFVPSRPLPPSSHSLLLLTTLLLQPTAPHYHHSLPPLTTTTHYHHSLSLLLTSTTASIRAGCRHQAAPRSKPSTPTHRAVALTPPTPRRDGTRWQAPPSPLHRLHRCTAFTHCTPCAPVHLCTAAPLSVPPEPLQLCTFYASAPLHLCR